VKRHFLCFQTTVNKGIRYGRADIIGIRDIGGDLSGDIETIAVEVKKGDSPFLTASGQTFGYNVFAHRVYLADKRDNSFEPDELQIASHLGIGLIQIRGKKCVEVLFSPHYNPNRRFNLALLENLGLGRCQLCESFFGLGDEEKAFTKVTREKVQQAIETGKGLMFWNDEVALRKDKLGIRRALNSIYDRRFICSDCVANLLTIEENRLKSWFSEYGRRE